MARPDRPAPGRPRWGPGAVFFLAIAALAGAGGCEEVVPGRDPPVLVLDGDTVALDPDASLHEVLVGGSAGAGFRPDTVRVRTGDVVRFVAADARTHAVAFDPHGPGAERAAFLDRTGQIRSPPLIRSGASWVVSFRDAPSGDYPFVCLSHQARGLVTVRP